MIGEPVEEVDAKECPDINGLYSNGTSSRTGRCACGEWLKNNDAGGGQCVSCNDSTDDDGND